MLRFTVTLQQEGITYSISTKPNNKCPQKSHTTYVLLPSSNREYTAANDTVTKFGRTRWWGHTALDVCKLQPQRRKIWSSQMSNKLNTIDYRQSSTQLFTHMQRSPCSYFETHQPKHTCKKKKGFLKLHTKQN